MAYVIRVIDTAIPGLDPNVRDTYVVDYEDTPDGRGETWLTKDLDKAKRFESFEEAASFWNQRSKTVPTRPDGKPNKPLTAFTTEIKPVEEEEGG